MSRLLLEICPDNASTNAAESGTPLVLPPILICSSDDQAAVAIEGLPSTRPLILRFQNGSYALQQPSGPAAAPLGIGQWHNADGWKFRVTQATPNDDQLGNGNPSWAAPELRITTYDGERVKRLRCMLPTEEASQLVIGRDGAKADLVVEDEHVSRAHLRFFVDAGKHLVEDLGSRWGSKLNDQPLTDARPLAHGDEIRLGKSSIQYICYWDLLPQAASKGAAISVAVESPPKPSEPLLATPKVEATSAAKAAEPKPIDVKPSADPKPAPEVKVVPDPVTAPKPAAAAAPSAAAKPAIPKTPAKRNWAGFDIGGAIVLVLLLLAGMAYLAHLVFGP